MDSFPKQTWISPQNWWL